MGNLDGAQHAYEESARTAPAEAEPLIRLGFVYLVRGQLSAARGKLESALGTEDLSPLQEASCRRFLRLISAVECARPNMDRELDERESGRSGSAAKGE